MIVAVFRSRLREEAREEYMAWAKRMTEMATAMPGYIAHKLFAAEDGERLMHVEFESEATMRAWGAHPEHIAAKRLGRERFFTAYRAQVCTVIHEVKFDPAG
jgi:heme-degrading monooxygenase HmoA